MKQINKLGVKEFRKQIATLIVGAFGFVAALFWRDAIQAIIAEYIPKGSTWPYMFLSALVVTIMAVVVIYLIAKYLAPPE